MSGNMISKWIRLMLNKQRFSMILWTHNDFLSRRMRYPVWIHRCKRPNYDFWISQGSVATALRWGGQNDSHLRQFIRNVVCQKLLKSANVSRSYSKNNTGTVFFLRHGDIEIIVGRVYCQLPKGAYREKELNWIELNWTELNWTEMSWFASSSA